MDYIKKAVEGMKNNAEFELKNMIEHREMLLEQLGKVDADIKNQQEKIEQCDKFLNPPPVAQRLVATINLDGAKLAKEVVERVKEDIEKQVNKSYYHPRA